MPTPALSADFARYAARQIDRLAEHLAAAGPEETRQILTDALDEDDGVLGRTVMLLATASYRAQHHGDPIAAQLGQLVNDMHDLVVDLDAALNPAPSATAAPPRMTATPIPARRTR